VYHVGIPTISGSGVEASNSITLIGADEKIEVHSNFLCFNQVLLDPELTRTVLKQDWFYTGVHCFIKAVEGKHSFNRNTLSTSYSDIAYRLCIDVFIQQELSKREAQDKLMVASWHSGIPTNYTQMGIAQALSYGLSYILELQHNKAICIVFKYLEEFYAEDVLLFNKMLELHDIIVPEGLCLNVLEKDINRMVDIALSLEYLWENTLGRHWKKSITPKKIKDLYLSM
jgi:3-deoxy-alpha-D-manno-octulosonate 8-oxidase